MNISEMSVNTKTKKDIIAKLKKTRQKEMWYKIPYKSIEENYKYPCRKSRRPGALCSAKNLKRLNIDIVAVPCHGFGDIIFAAKIAAYVKEWYNSKIKIVTTTPNLFKILGIRDIPLVGIKGKGNPQCRRFVKLNVSGKRLGKPDLILIAPHMTGFDISYADIRKLYPHATPFNTMFFSEYQDALNKKHDFPTGVGPKRLGLLFDRVKPKIGRQIRGPYALAYIAMDAGPKRCFYNFIEMVAKKYRIKYPRLHVVVLDWLAQDLIEYPNMIKRRISKYYNRAEVILENKTTVLYDTSKGRGGRRKKRTIIFEGDILPMPRKDMLNLMKYSIPDILVTGDQSLTDVLGCCSKKNIWYQTGSWKENFRKALFKEMPNSHFRTSGRACGGIKALRWKSNYTKFLKNNDFRKGGKHRLDAVVRSILEYKTRGSFIKTYIDAVNSSRTRKGVLNKLDKMI